MTMIVPTRIKLIFLAFTFLRLKASIYYLLNFNKLERILKHNYKILNEISGKTVSIIGNAPSAKSIDISKLADTKILCK